MMEISETAITFTDDLGRSVTVENPKRTATLLGSFAQVWVLAGGEVTAAPVDAWEDFDLELSEGTVNLGEKESMSLELLMEAEPDFVLASTNTKQHLEWQEILEAMGIPVAYFDIDNFDDYLRLLEICTDITGCEDRYEKYGLDVQDQIDKVIAESEKRLEKQEPPKVLSVVASSVSLKAKNSEGTVLGAMLHTLGCENIADSSKVLLDDLSLEHILVEDPDYIFFVQRGNDEEGMKERVREYLMEHPAWSELTAVKNERVYFMDKSLFHLKPNHRWGEAYEMLEEILQQ